ncbi:MAG: Peptidyl-dipeptidase precursor, partial [Myxococcaceae bacterium]|nr:Peptidyl-dipeptidase precursor [Myxococcaceae bacterium]
SHKLSVAEFTSAGDGRAAFAHAAPKRPEQVRLFLESVDQQLRTLSVAAMEADWAKSTNITDQTEERAAQANEVLMAYLSEAIRVAATYRDVAVLSASDARKLELLRRGSSLPAPQNPAHREELSAIASRMESLYGKGKGCSPKTGVCRDLEQLSDVMAQSRDEPSLRAAWQQWHAVGTSIKPLFARYVTLANEGAREIGFRNLGELWRSRYDMMPQLFEHDVGRLWSEVAPLYEQLHCYARAKLRARYGKSKVPERGPIPAHLLGNMWAQSWESLYPELEPHPGQGELDVTKALKQQHYDETRMVKLGESFFSSLGFRPLPETFWQRSMLRRPAGREVVCHASAWDVHFNNDVRIKMCTKIDHEDLITIHHELGHIYYFSQYYKLPMLFQDGANDGFHEAIGDAIALSVTPDYLVHAGLLERAPGGEKGALNLLMQRALDKVAFLPFGKVVDEWRWKVFSGEIAPEHYNQTWWELRQKVQGIAPPSPRGEQFFDAGAKYHVAANVPYARYFLATVLQYQFHRALCKIAGHQGPLHACSIFGNKAAGARLQKMLALGAEKPWPDALEVLTGERALDATAIVDYFAPLMTWLKQQNAGRTCGWQ